MRPEISGIRERIVGRNGLDWLDRSYGIDWLVILGIWMLSWAVYKTPIFEREFDLNDPLINHPIRHDQVSSAMNFFLSFWVPTVIVGVNGLLNHSLLEIHHGIIALLAGQGLTTLITVLGKHLIGRLRPDFLARCNWDKVLGACTGPLERILGGRQSFPSGHSSTAFSGMTFLALWLAGKTASWSFTTPRRPSSLKSSRMASFFLTLLPILWASFVAITRLQDYRHHKEDVLTGALIGITCAMLSYLIFWPSPFLAKNFEENVFGKPRMLYVLADKRIGDVEFQLTRLEDELETGIVY